MLLLLLRNSSARVLAGGVPPGGFVTGPTVRASGGPAPPSPYTPRLSLWIVERDGTPVVELPESFGRHFTSRLDGTGAGQFSVGMDDANAAEVTYGRLARFFIDDQARFAMLISAVDRTELAQGEEVDQVVDVTGPSTFSVLEEGIVAPGPGSPVDNPDVRSFNFSSPGGTGTVVVNGTPTPGSSIMPAPDPASWPNPISAPPPGLGPVNFPVGPAAFDPDPPADPAPPAEWITAPGSNTDLLYYTQEFTVADPTPILVNVSASGPVLVFIDGVLVAQGPGEYRRETLNARLALESGSHVLAAIVDPPASGGAAAVIARVATLNAAGRSTQSLAATRPGVSPTIGVVRSPTAPTPVTSGGIVAVLIAEAQARGCFPDVTIGFDGQVDSAGELWDPVEEFSVSVGDDTVLSVCKKLTEAGYGWFRMAAGQMRLDGYATLPDTAAVTLAAGVDLTELKHEGTG